MNRTFHSLNEGVLKFTWTASPVINDILKYYKVKKLNPMMLYVCAGWFSVRWQVYFDLLYLNHKNFCPSISLPPTPLSLSMCFYGKCRENTSSKTEFHLISGSRGHVLDQSSVLFNHTSITELVYLSFRCKS